MTQNQTKEGKTMKGYYHVDGTFEDDMYTGETIDENEYEEEDE
jgi:hypothetical protein